MPGIVSEAIASLPLRVRGVAVLALGLVVAWHGYGRALADPSASLGNAPVHLGAQLFTPLVLVYGVLWTLLGPKSAPWLGTSLAGDRTAKIAAAVLVALGVVLMVLFRLVVGSGE
jgi:hypothetical protein